MNDRFHRWFLHEVVQETHDTITILFDIKGQEFHYKAGQFINITQVINGQVVTRSYSLSSSPYKEYPSITVKKVKEGIMSNFLFDNARNIQEWEIEGPYGNFLLQEPIGEADQLCFLAGGSGITPLFSMMKTITGKAKPSHLVYSNRNSHDVIFHSQIQEVVQQGRASVFHALTGDVTPEAFGEDLFRGRLSRLIVKKLIKQKFENPLKVIYYICGPAKLMEVYREAVQSLGVPEEQILMESFSTELSEPVAFSDQPHEVLMHVYESTSLIDVKAGQSLLESALENGLEIKYSCKKGTCGSCWGRYTEGEVKMINNYALTKEEVENKYILLCQSYPLDDKLTVHVG